MYPTQKFLLLRLLTEYVKPFMNFPRLPTSPSSSWMTPPLFFLISQTEWKPPGRQKFLSSSLSLQTLRYPGQSLPPPSCSSRGSIWFFNRPLVHCGLAPVSSAFSRTSHYCDYPFSSVSSLSPSQLGLSDWYFVSPIFNFTNALRFTKPPLACFTNRRWLCSLSVSPQIAAYILIWLCLHHSANSVDSLCWLLSST